MLDINYLKELLIISIALSVITCTLIQKTKGFLKSSKFITLYSFIINMGIGILFCLSFTKIVFPNYLWIGFFSFLGADSIYKSLEGKISSYSDIVSKKSVSINEDNIINKEDK